jgi:hypothetical protein
MESHPFSVNFTFYVGVDNESVLSGNMKKSFCWFSSVSSYDMGKLTHTRRDCYAYNGLYWIGVDVIKNMDNISLRNRNKS